MRGQHEPHRRRHRLLRSLGDVVLLFVVIAAGFAVFGVSLFVVLWIALKFA
jgi:hypothetical protein